MWLRITDLRSSRGCTVMPSTGPAATGGGAGSGFSAARTTSGVNGGLRKRTPVA